MKMNKIAGFFLCMLLAQSIDAQTIRENYTLKWRPPVVEQISDEITWKYLYFDKAVLSNDEKLMPWFFCEFPAASENLLPQVKVLNTSWEAFSAEELEVLDLQQISDTLIIKAYVESTRKKPDAKITFLPMRKNGNTYEKLVSFQIECTLTPVPSARTQKSGTYASNSILRSGSFYKMAITKTGIHKVTHADLVAMGISKTVYTKDIAVFGNGGKLLPEAASEPVPDDLQEVALQIVDQNGNGIFDKDDYFLFYGVGVVNWNSISAPSPEQRFAHELNFYSSQAYYFLTADAGIGEKKRISNAVLSNAPPTHQLNSYYFRDVYEKEAISILEKGRIWFGEEFNGVTSYKFPFTVPGRLKDKRVFLKIQVASKSNSYATFTASINGGSSFSMPIGNNRMQDFTFNNVVSSGDDIEINLSYNKPTNSSIGYLDYIEVHTTCALAQNTGQFSFRNPEAAGSGNVAEYQFDTKGKSTQIWDVTDPFNAKKINVSANQGNITYKIQMDNLREFAAFDGSSFYSVTPVGAVANQNLHALKDLDFIIITHPNFMQSAERLASHRRSNDGMKVAVVTTTQVYNEFGSGICDISAIRNFLKMFYDLAETEQEIPKNALLIGKTSFDPRNITGSNSCFIPNYQGGDPFNGDCPSTDNFFTKLADGKGLNSAGTMDMGVGRFSVSNTSQASVLVEKSITYSSMNDLADNNSTYVSNLGDWRNIVAFVADDNAEGEHIDNPENIYNFIAPSVPFINFDKIYSDAYVAEISANGKRYPAVNKAINSRVNRGCLMMSYFGHGGDNGWAHERILQRSDILSWSNKYCLPFMFTGCCNFANYDKKDGLSPAEDVSLRANGGAIGLITSTRNTDSYNNEKLSTQIHKWAFEQIDNRYLTLGEIHAKAQKDFGGSGYDFQILLGDPSATIARPKWEIATDSINGTAFADYNDTLKALQYVTITGHIRDNAGNPAKNFNGWIFPTIFDKADTVTTLNPPTEQFVQQKNIIFKGKSEVKDGYFSFRFIIPKDIDYTVGDGKISYYAKSEGVDALGCNRVRIGSVSDAEFNDTAGPQIKLYLNDEKFVSGGITDPNPIVFAKISDETGINTASSGIGHDIVAILDNNVAKSITLNDYFEFDENSFTSGKLRYPLSDLAIGKHTLTLRAWDVLNNMNEATIDFEVVDNKDLELKHVLNYPNPFTTSTQFFFEHNRPNTPLLISIQIMTISGKVVKTIIPQQQSTSGYRSEPIHWNGLDEFGDKLAKGVYIYKLKVIAPDGSWAEKIEKLVIL
ncbi:MAG: type IX secretion system sortase PorU [Lentimicrobiaceae bacterium]|nr:type IX secretion system sortase PorU [Lentimicrobiaceae bacterium]